MATVTTRRKPESAPEQPATLADLLRRLGNIPARRVRLHPAPGTATERDVLLNNESRLRTAICELVDGTLVEKPMGWEESAIAVLIGHFLVAFAKPRKLGTVLGADGMLRLVPGLVRVPDVSFLAQGKLTRYQRGGQRIPSVAADLAVEVISKSNTKAEIARKLVRILRRRYASRMGCRPEDRTVRVHTSPRESVVLGIDDVLDGGDVLPGLRLPVRDVFEIGE